MVSVEGKDERTFLKIRGQINKAAPFHTRQSTGTMVLVPALPFIMNYRLHVQREVKILPYVKAEEQKQTCVINTPATEEKWSWELSDLSKDRLKKSRSFQENSETTNFLENCLPVHIPQV